jgi:hypothetical protein
VVQLPASRLVQNLMRGRPHIVTLPSVLLGWTIAVGSHSPGLAVDGCLLQPTHEETNGGRWYYRLDRVNHRKCWYVKKLRLDWETTVWLDVALSPQPRQQPTFFSWFASLSAVLWEPSSTESRPQTASPDSPLIQASATARLTTADVIPKRFTGAAQVSR